MTTKTQTKRTKAGAAFLARVGNYVHSNDPEWMPITHKDLRLIGRHDLQPFLDVRGEDENRRPMPEITDSTHHLAVRWTGSWRQHMEAARDRAAAVGGRP